MSRPKLLLGVRTALGLFWLSAICVILRGLSDSPLRLSAKGSLNMLAAAPEGWAFFTRSAREAATFVYRREPDGWAPVLHTNADPAYLYGLRRTQRAQHMELGPILAQVPRRHWTKGRLRRGEVARELGTPLAVDNGSPDPTLCGEHVVQTVKPVPWAWSRSRETLAMEGYAVALRVRCRARGDAPTPAAAASAAVRHTDSRIATGSTR